MGEDDRPLYASLSSLSNESPLWGVGAGLPLVIVAVALVSLTVGHTLVEPASTFFEETTENVIFLLLLLPLFVVAYDLARGPFVVQDGVVVATASLVGSFTSTAILDVVIVLHEYEGIQIGEQPALLLATMTGGALLGTVSSYGYVRTRRTLVALETATEQANRLATRLSIKDRILRHNLRNELGVIQGTSALVEEQVDDPAVNRHLETLRESTDSLLTVSQISHHIHRLFETNDERASQDLASVFADRIATIGDRYPAVEFRTNLPETLPVSTHPKLPEAITLLLTTLCENALGEVASARIDVGAAVGETATITLTVPEAALPAEQRLVLRGEEETALDHPIDMDLWFLYWTVVVSGGTCTYRERPSDDRSDGDGGRSPPLEIRLTLPLDE